ncbi:LuxR C-terminal-related transcriptional regulator [Gordonia sp. DT219]|uniref:helix-turn-helix transcriptional regulator n=1 Tax=Gordonia sp. DT219 TaxID=3416658 RepID=UPI003CF58DE2
MSSVRAVPKSADDGVVGRRGIIDRIDDVLHAASSGIPDAVHTLTIAGNPGSGRSTMLAVAARHGAALGMRTLSARGFEAESTEPFAGLHEFLLPLLCDVPADDVPAELGVAVGLASGPSPDVRRVADAVVVVIAAQLARGPMLLLIDDLRQLDRESITVVEAIADRQLPGLSLIATTRAGRAALASGSRLMLGPLTEAESDRVLSAEYPDLEPRLRRGVLAASLGNPLAITEIPRSLTSAQRTGAEPVPDRPALTARLRRQMSATITELPPDTRLLLLMHAIDPGRELRAFDAVLGGGDALVASLPAVGAGLVELTDGAQIGIHSLHPVALHMIETSAVSAERDLVHRVLGAVFVADGAPDPAAVAQVSSVRRRASLMEAAAEAACRQGDWRSAVASLEAAARVDTTASECARRLARAAYLASSVDLTLAARLVGEMREHDRTAASTLGGALAIAAVTSRGDATELDMAHRLLDEAIGHRRRRDAPDPMLIEAIGELRWVCWLSGRNDLWQAYQRVAAEVTAHHAVTDIAHRTALSVLLADRLSVAEIERAAVAVDRHTDPTAIILVAEAAAAVDRVAVMAPHLERLIAGADDRGPVMPAVWATLLLADGDLERGAFTRAQSRLDHARSRWGAAGFNLLSWGADAQQARLAAVRGDPADVADRVARPVSWAIPRRARTVLTETARAELMSAAARSDAIGVLERAAAVGPIGEFADDSLPARAVALDIVVAARQVGRLDVARAHVDAMTRAGFGLISPRCSMIHLAAQACVLPDDAARTLFRAALAVPGAQQWPFDLARIHYYFGAHLRRMHAVAESREPLSTALQLFAGMECRHWAELVRAELDTAVVARQVFGGPAAGGLTHRELRIAEAAASGLSNKAIGVQTGISARTVGNHLHHVYVKLGIGSRGGLRDALRELRADADDTQNTPTP